MKVVIAIDSFKGSLSSSEAARSIKRGVLAAKPTADIEIFPLADGGEGTVDALCAAYNATTVSTVVSDPIGRRISADYALSKDGSTAIIEMSAAAGITLLTRDELDPMHATTFGVGQMILDALERGVSHVVMGIGGSATNDAGIGMLAALGYEFFDSDGSPIKPFGAAACGKVAKISDKRVINKLKNCKFTVACDVKNPLLGKNGCSAIFSPQKGAKPDEIEIMDGYLKNFSEAAKKYTDNANATLEGAGAAGGLGFALSAFLFAELVSGAELVIREGGIEVAITECDVVVTGEGKMDAQSSMGKAPYTVALTAKKYGKRVVAFCGAVDSEALSADNPVFDGIFPIATSALPIEVAMSVPVASRNLEFTARQVFKLLQEK